MVNLILGVDNCFGGKRWPEPEIWIRIIKNTLGLKVVEFDSDLLDPLYIDDDTSMKVASEIKGIAAREGIFIHNYFTGEMTHLVNLISHPDKRIRKNGIIWVEKALKLATNLGAKGIGGHFDCISSDNLSGKNYKYYVDNLIDNFIYFSEIAFNEGHEILMLEQMYTPNEIPYTIRQTHEIINRINKKSKIFVSPVIDLGHSCCQNYEHSKEDRDPYQWLREFGSISEVVHVQQTTSDASHHWPFTGEYNNKGIINPEKVINALEKSGSKQNYLMLEIFFPLRMNDKQILDAMVETVQYWKGYV